MHLLSRAAVFAGALLIGLLSSGSTATACMHPAEGLEVDENAQSAIVMYKNGVQRLYLQPSIRAEGSGDVAWVIPVPSVPHEYTIASEAFVNWVERTLAITELRRERSARRTKGGVKEHEPLQVGRYRIQAIEARGAEGVEALTQWLESNEFPTGDPELLAYYVDNAWAFVTVRTSLEGSSDEDSDPLSPIALEFESPAPVVPVRLMAHKNAIEFRAWFLSDEELQEEDFRHAHDEFALEVTADRRKRSDWDSISDTWVLAQGSIYLSQLRENAPVIHELERLYPDSTRLWVYGVAGSISPKLASAASEELFFGPSDTSLDMTDFEPSAKRDSDSLAPASDANEDTAEPIADLESDIEEKLKEKGSSAEIDWTTVSLVVGAFFVFTVFLLIQFMRRR